MDHLLRQLFLNRVDFGGGLAKVLVSLLPLAQRKFSGSPTYLFPSVGSGREGSCT